MPEKIYLAHHGTTIGITSLLPVVELQSHALLV